MTAFNYILYSLFQPCSSTGIDTETNFDEFIKTLSYDEINASIEIVKQLQEALINPNERSEDFSENDIKEERESEGLLNQPGENSKDQKLHSEVSSWIVIDYFN